MLLKKSEPMSQFEQDHLMALREAWTATNGGRRACVVVNREMDWNDILGKYCESLLPRVSDGMIYKRILNSIVDQVTVEDLENTIVDLGNIL